MIRSAVVLAFLLVTSTSFAQSGPDSPVVRRWMAKDRGDLLVICHPSGNGDPTLGVLHLPAAELEVIRLDPAYIPNERMREGVAWGGNRDIVYFRNEGYASAESGIYRLDRSTGRVSQVLAEGVWHFRNAPEKMGVPKLSGSFTGFRTPETWVRFDALRYSSKTKTLYLDLVTGVNPGPPGWRMDLDSTDLPVWAKEFIQAHIGSGGGPAEGRFRYLRGRRWTRSHLAEVDNLGNVTWIAGIEGEHASGLTTSEDGRLIGIQAGELGALEKRRTYIYDRETRVSLYPQAPPGVRMDLPALTADGSAMAVAGIDSLGSSVYVTHGPEFTDYRLLAQVNDGIPDELCWSPDGEWLMLFVRTHYVGHDVVDLIVIEASTGEWLHIPRPYTLNGRPAPHVTISAGLDWIQ